MKNLILILLIGFFSCKPNIEKSFDYTALNNIKAIKSDTIKYTNGFDFPVGKPNAKGYYNAQGFTKNNHLGDDWNGVNGGNTDLGDTIYSIANGYVSFAENIGGGWGNVIRIKHYINRNEQIESLYAHCNSIKVKKGEYVTKGHSIGTIGNNNRQFIGMMIRSNQVVTTCF